MPLDRVLAAVRSSSDRPIPLPRRALEEIPMSDRGGVVPVTASRPGGTDADQANAAEAGVDQLIAALRRIHRPAARDRSLCAGCLSYLPCPTLIHVDRFAAAAPSPATTKENDRA